MHDPEHEADGRQACMLLNPDERPAPTLLSHLGTTNSVGGNNEQPVLLLISQHPCRCWDSHARPLALYITPGQHTVQEAPY